MAELSPEALVRLQEAEDALHKKWGRSAGILMTAFASSLFIDATACCETHKAETLMQVIEAMYGRIVPKMWPNGQEAITADLDAFLTLLFKENFPNESFLVTRDATGINIEGTPKSGLH